MDGLLRIFLRRRGVFGVDETWTVFGAVFDYNIATNPKDNMPWKSRGVNHSKKFCTVIKEKLKMKSKKWLKKTKVG